MSVGVSTPELGIGCRKFQPISGRTEFRRSELHSANRNARHQPANGRDAESTIPRGRFAGRPAETPCPAADARQGAGTTKRANCGFPSVGRSSGWRDVESAEPGCQDSRNFRLPPREASSVEHTKAADGPPTPGGRAADPPSRLCPAGVWPARVSPKSIGIAHIAAHPRRTPVLCRHRGGA